MGYWVSLQGTCRCLTDLLKLCYTELEKGHSTADGCDSKNFLLGCLMTNPLELRDYLYFGEHVFPVACQWINAQVPYFGAAVGAYGEPGSMHIPTSYLIMLGGSCTPACNALAVALMPEASLQPLSFIFESLDDTMTICMQHLQLYMLRQNRRCDCTSISKCAVRALAHASAPASPSGSGCLLYRCVSCKFKCMFEIEMNCLTA